MDYKIVEAVGIASKLQSDIEKWYLDSSQQISHLKALCKQIQDETLVPPFEPNTTTDEQKVNVVIN